MGVRVPQKRGIFSTWFIMLHKVPTPQCGPSSVCSARVEAGWAGRHKRCHTSGAVGAPCPGGLTLMSLHSNAYILHKYNI